MEEVKKHLEECRKLFDNLPDPGGLLDSRGNFLLVTKAFEELMGKGKSQLIGKNAFTAGFFDKNFEKIALGNMKKWLSGKVVPKHDIHLNVKGGRRITAQTRNSILEYQGNKCFLFILIDVTEQRKAEKKLQDSEKKFRDILMNTSDIVWEVDEKGRIFFISGKVKEVLGYEAKELIGKTPYFFMSPKEKVRCKKIFHSHLIRKENIYDFETEVLTKSGEQRVFLTNGVPVLDNQGKLIGYRGVEKDITDRKRTEERFQELFDNMSSGVAIYRIEKEGKKVVFANFNKGGEKIESTKRDKIIGQDLLSIFPEAKKIGIFDAIIRAWRTGEAEKIVVKVRNKKNLDLWHDNYIYRLSSGEVVSIYDDITEEVELHRLIEENEKKFRKIFELSPEAIVIIDERAQIVDLNNRVAEWLGYDTKEVIGKNLLELPFLSEKYKALVLTKFKERMQKQGSEILPYEIEFINKNKKIFHGRIYTRKILSFDESHYQDLVMISDITKEKEIENTRLERQEELEKMNGLMVGRELKMIELKEKIQTLEEKLKQLKK